MSVAENYILDSYHQAPYSKNGIFDLKAVRERAAQGVKDFDIRTPSIDTMAGSLSGGNQQKVVVAREFSVPVQLVIAAQPTRGLDVGSIEYIHRRIVEQRDAGAAIVIVSTELDEVLAVGDRIAVMFDGRIVGILEGDDATYENLGLLMGGATFGEGTPHEARSPGLLRRALVPVLAVVTALLFGAIVIILTDFDNAVPAHDRPREPCSGWIGQWQDRHQRRDRRRGQRLRGDARRGLRRSRPDHRPRSRPATPRTSRRRSGRSPRRWSQAMPLIFCGLAIAISFRAGMFNIGGDGQLMHRCARGDDRGHLARGHDAAGACSSWSASSRRRSSARSGASYPASSRREPAPTRSSPRSCSISSPQLVVFFALRSPAFGQPEARRRSRRTSSPIVDVPNIINLPDDSGSTTASSWRC